MTPSHCCFPYCQTSLQDLLLPNTAASNALEMAGDIQPLLESNFQQRTTQHTIPMSDRAVMLATYGDNESKRRHRNQRLIVYEATVKDTMKLDNGSVRRRSSRVLLRRCDSASSFEEDSMYCDCKS